MVNEPAGTRTKRRPVAASIHTSGRCPPALAVRQAAAASTSEKPLEALTE